MTKRGEHCFFMQFIRMFWNKLKTMMNTQWLFPMFINNEAVLHKLTHFTFIHSCEFREFSLFHSVHLPVFLVNITPEPLAELSRFRLYIFCFVFDFNTLGHVIREEVAKNVKTRFGVVLYRMFKDFANCSKSRMYKHLQSSFKNRRNSNGIQLQI